MSFKNRFKAKSKANAKVKSKNTSIAGTLHDYFHTAASPVKGKSSATVACKPHEIILIESDSDDDVEIIQKFVRPEKKQRVDNSTEEIEFVVQSSLLNKKSPGRNGPRPSDNSHTSASHSGCEEYSRSTNQVLEHQDTFNEEPIAFGMPTLLLSSRTVKFDATLPNPPPMDSSSFGIPSLLLPSIEENSSILAASQTFHLPGFEDLTTHREDGDWGTGDDETALSTILEDVEGEECLKDYLFEDFDVTKGSLRLDVDPEGKNDLMKSNTGSPLLTDSSPFLPPPLPPSAPEREHRGGDRNLFSMLMSASNENEAWKEASDNDKGPKSSRNRKNNSSSRKAPFYKVLQGMPIAVDAFCYGAIPGVTAYFLTHAHSDHYTNLSSRWTSGPIYCSDGTANLIIHMLGVDRKWVHALPMDVPTEVPNTGGVSVTLIEANHCPGSSMFFFEGRQTINAGDSTFKSPFIGSARVFRYLHCGDFRASPQHVLHPAVNGKKIDHVYLDTTYLDPKHTFPPQVFVIAACAELSARIVTGKPISPQGNYLLDSWIKTSSEISNLSNPTPKTLFVVGTYSIGKERVAKAIAQAINSKIYCDSRKTAILRCQPDPELHGLLTSNPLDACVHLIPLGMVTSDRLKIYVEKYKSTFGKAVGFRPTGWTFTAPAGTELIPSVASILSRPYRDFTYADLRPAKQSTHSLQLFPVPYSEHSSFFELTCFAMSFDWAKMIATVNVGSETSREKIAKWIAKWQAERKKREVDVMIPYRHPDYW